MERFVRQGDSAESPVHVSYLGPGKAAAAAAATGGGTDRYCSPPADWDCANIVIFGAF